MNDKIDIIVPWVDGSDPAWIREKEECGAKCRPDKNPYLIPVFKAGIIYNIGFVQLRNLCHGLTRFLVTWGHVPHFLNTSHPKLRIIRHEDYIPREYLPTFNSNTIEMNYHRIEELSENFIIFNDDLFPLQPIEETYYFKNNIVCDEAVEGLLYLLK